MYGSADGSVASVGISVGTNGVSVYEHYDSHMPAILVWPGTVSGWTHIAVVVENRTPKLYINGVLVRIGLQLVVPHLKAGNLIGSGYYGTMIGELDEVRIWSVVRTQSQIAADMNGTVASPQTGLAAYWPISPGGNGTTLQDISGNNYNVTLPSSYSNANFTSTGAPITAVTSNAAEYRYGFSGKENDKDISDGGQDYGMRIYDSRLGKFLSVDPLASIYPWNSPYSYAEGDPINFTDIDGGERGSIPEQAIQLPTLPKLTVPEVEYSETYINKTIKYSPLTIAPVNSGSYTPQTRYITQQEFENAIPPYCSGVSIDLDKMGATIYDANGHGAHISFIKKVEAIHKVPTMSEIVDEGKRASERSKILQTTLNWKNSIYTEKATPLVINPLNTFQRITTDARNLKGQDIIDLKNRIAKGTATDQDKIYASQLVKERLDYQINPKHAGQGGPNASVLPTNHANLWDNKSTYDEVSDTWWSAEGKGNNAVFHQFMGDKLGTYHWAGSTSKNSVNSKGGSVKPVSTNKVPIELKRKVGLKG